MDSDIRIRQIVDSIKSKRLEVRKIQKSIKQLQLYGNLLRLGISNKEATKLLSASAKKAAADDVDKEEKK